MVSAASQQNTGEQLAMIKAQIDSLTANIVAANGEEELYAGFSLLERLVSNILKNPNE